MQIAFAGKELSTNSTAYLEPELQRPSDQQRQSEDYSRALRDAEQKLRSVWDPKFHGAKRLDIDVIVGSYKEIAGVLPCIPAMYIVHFVFDEVQEATSAESQRFHAPFGVFTQLQRSFCNGLTLTGCNHILELRANSLFSPFLDSWDVLEFR